MGICSHHSWVSGSSKLLFNYRGALSPAVALKIPSHLVLPPRLALLACILQACRGTVSLSGIIFRCLCSRLLHCWGGLLPPSLFIFQNPSRVFFLDPPGQDGVAFLLCSSDTYGYHVLLYVYTGVCPVSRTVPCTQQVLS